MHDDLLLTPEVLKQTGLPISTLYHYRKTGRFPAPVRLGMRSVAYRAADVAAWIERRGALRTITQLAS